MIPQLFQWLPDTPIVEFTILLLVSLTIPPWFERLKLPGLVGLLVAGVVFGSHGLQLLDPDSETLKLFSDIGKIYLMFVAGLEIDLVQFQRQKNRSLGFGFATFAVPLLTGTLIGFAFGFGPNASILIGSLLASHTLLGYPIVQRLGLVDVESVIVTIGATIFTDISALFVLAICVSIHAGEFSGLGFILQLGTLIAYSAIVLLGFDRLGKIYFRRTGNNEGNQFLFVLLVLFVASVGAKLIAVDMIVGAFLAGLAINDVVGTSPVKEKVEFLGSVLFIPFFFVAMGLLLDVPVFISTLSTSFGLTIAIVLGLIGSKFLAAWIAQFLYGYSWAETAMMWSLSVPQVAATLAAALVGFEVGLLSEAVFNSIIVLMLVTSIVGPMMTQRVAPRLLAARSLPAVSESLWWENRRENLAEEPAHFTVVVPVSNPHTERYLMAMAVLLAKHEKGAIVPLSVATHAQIHMDEPELQQALKHGRMLLQQAIRVGEAAKVRTTPALRIDSDVATGIIRTACERDASLIVMGWSLDTGLRTRLFGNLIDSVFWSSHCPVAVMRLLADPVEMRQILVPVKNLTPQTMRTVRFAQLLADTNGARVILLHVCQESAPPEHLERLKSELANMGGGDRSIVQLDIQIVSSDDVAAAILSAAETADLVVLRSQRRRTVGGLEVSNITSQILGELRGSTVLFGEPQT